MCTVSARRVSSGVLWESRTTAVRAVIAAILDRARATRLEARCAVEKPEVDPFEVARVATTPSAPATRAPAPAHSPAPELPRAAP